MVLSAVKQDGYALEYADNNLKTDRGIVLEAVRNQGKALNYASQLLKTDLSVPVFS